MQALELEGRDEPQTDRQVGLTRLPSPGLALKVHASMAAVEAEWRAMQAHSLVSPHHGYDWCRAWVEAMPRPLAIVEGRLDGRPAFILPLEIVTGRMFRSARFIGAEHTNINTGLFTEAFLAAATPALTAEIVARIRTLDLPADCVNLNAMPQKWRGAAMPFARLDGVENHNHTFQLDLRATFDCTLAEINGKKRRKNFRAAERRLEKMGGYEYLTAETDADKTRMLDHFFRLKAARFAETGIPDCFASRQVKAFFHKAVLANGSDDDFALRMHAIRLKGSDDFSAIAGVSRKGDHVICQFTTIGTGPERIVSPGEMLFYRMIEHYNGDHARIFDFGMGDSRLKQSWTTSETVQYDITIPLNAIGRLAQLKDEATLKAKAIIKQNPALYSLIQRIRARSGHAGDGDEAGLDERND